MGSAGANGLGRDLAAKLWTGRAGSNTAIDHIEVLDAAITQIPGTHRRDLLIHSECAGASQDLAPRSTMTPTPNATLDRHA